MALGDRVEAGRTLAARPLHRPGNVVWVDLSTTDLDGAIHFYERMLGWHYTEQVAEMGTYVIARVAAGEVGGLMSQAPEHIAAGVPPSWTIFVDVEHLDATLATARELGGSVLQSPLSMPGGARAAVIADPGGAALALVEAASARSELVFGQPGSVCWVECLSRDPGAALEFYEELLGWTSEDGPGGYMVLSLDGERVGGLMAMPPNVPTRAPSYWLVYFAVADVAASCTRAIESGGAVLLPTHDIDEGRFAVLEDLSGAAFAVFEGPPHRRP